MHHACHDGHTHMIPGAGQVQRNIFTTSTYRQAALANLAELEWRSCVYFKNWSMTGA